MTRFTVLVGVAGQSSAAVISALRRRIMTFPAELKRTLTWDRGAEMSLHRDIKRHTGVSSTSARLEVLGSAERTRT